jgi:hypothetical protein
MLFPSSKLLSDIWRISSFDHLCYFVYGFIQQQKYILSHAQCLVLLLFYFFHFVWCLMSYLMSYLI